MKLIAEIAGETSTLNLRREGERIFAEIEGRHYTAGAREVERGVYLLTVGAQVYECRVNGAGGRGGMLEVHLKNHIYGVTLSDPKRLRGAYVGSAHGGGRASVTAPMPGKIVRVIVELGAQVQAGDGLVVVEAMKMQNEMKSPKSGRIVGLPAQAGATVNAGDLLVVVE